MPKPKSEKTFAAEEKFKKDVQTWFDSYQKSGIFVPRSHMDFKIKSSKNMSTVDDFIEVKVRFDVRMTAMLKDFKMKVKTARFITRFTHQTNWHELNIATPEWYIPVTIGDYKMKLVRTDWAVLPPVSFLMTLSSIQMAAAVTFPDELGIAILTAHKGSDIVRKKFPKYFVDHKGINRGALKHAKDWKVLKHYLEDAEITTSPDQPTICEIVRTISGNRADEALKKLIAKNNGVNLVTDEVEA